MSTIGAVERPRKLRAVLAFPLVRIIIFVVALAAVIAAVQIFAKVAGIPPHSFSGVLLAFVMVAGVLATYAGLVRALERRAVVELSTRRILPELAGGVFAGAALFALTMVALVALRQADIVVDGGWRALGYPLLDALIAAVIEETLIRGVLFRIVEESLGSWIALALSAALFGMLHAFNPGATPISCVAIALEAGVLLAAVYMLTRRLWVVIGLHFGWNFTEGGIFGASVSGSNAHGWLSSRFHGPDVLTGGAFGPEASVVAVVVCLAAGSVFLRLAWRRGNVVRPFWSRTRSS